MALQGEGRVDSENTLGVIIRTVMISGSGALSPGPLSASAIALGGLVGALGGFYAALGHMLFELPYVALIALSLARLDRSLSPRRKAVLLLFSAGFMLYFSIGLAQLALSSGGLLQGHLYLPVSGLSSKILLSISVGFLLTAANPYFLLWWLTVGQPIVSNASKSRRMFLTVYSSHVWMDYAWLTFLAAAGSMSRSVSGEAYNALMMLLSIALAYYGVKYLIAGLRLFRFGED
ncbi:MAG: LysE family translocator [Desulfurococcales archaeon]|nr:LysE family translocator [Desulfurococcales archaeon]